MSVLKIASRPLCASAGGDRQLGDQLLDPALDLVPDRANAVEVVAGRVVKIPVEVALAGEDRAHVAAAHGDQYIGGLGGVPVQFAGCVGGDVDADLAHGFDGDRVDLVGGFAAGRADLDGVAGQVAQPAGGHLGAAGVVHAHEQDGGLAARRAASSIVGDRVSH